jgi:AraC-like DNA-binding protein
MGAVDITEVALAAGYQTHAAFGKAFKQQFGPHPDLSGQGRLKPQTCFAPKLIFGMCHAPANKLQK